VEGFATQIWVADPCFGVTGGLELKREML